MFRVSIPICLTYVSKCKASCTDKTKNVVIIDNFIANSTLIPSSLSSLKKLENEFSHTTQSEDIRNDVVIWLHENDKRINPQLQQIISTIKSQIPKMLGEDVLAPKHVQVSSYRNFGSKYSLHRDNKPRSRINIDDDALWMSQSTQHKRHITCILYLTPQDWKRDDGGYLRCLIGCDDDDDDGYSAVEELIIEPKCNRLVLFKSREILHEVLPTNREGRIALTVWFIQ